jgi:hypothetical protein
VLNFDFRYAEQFLVVLVLTSLTVLTHSAGVRLVRYYSNTPDGSGAILVADNAVSHGHFLHDVLVRAFDDRRVDALVVLIGNGALLCRKI